jgi:hypothetical protein
MSQTIHRYGAFAVFAAGLCVVLPALAQSQVSDPATGLGVQVPEGFSLTRGTPRPKQDVVFNVRSDSGRPIAKNADGSLCAVSFAQAPSNARLTQQEINDWTAKPEWRNLGKAALELVFQVEKTESVEHQGVAGVVFSAVPKPSFPDQDVFMQMTLLETPRGRTTIACVTRRDNMPEAEPVFATIRAGVQMPR